MAHFGKLRVVASLSLGLLLGACFHGHRGDDDDADCYSPTQNAEHAYDEGSVGCACESSEPGQCIEGVALVCNSGQWRAVVDGPCFPGPSEACGAGFCSQFAHCDELAEFGPTCVANP